RESVMIAAVVCLSMMVVIAFAKIVGGMLPMLAKKIGIDPALMATPMISSITDMASVLTYFLLASILLGI
ncbi:MAG: magnesium transporter, partial [Firmicutes bacterium]|nr:magnesium transporter [Bacillota bacterium]